MNLALYGGSFNPPHNGHVALVRRAIEELNPDKLLIMPSGDPPHRALPQGTPSAAHRLELCRLAFRGLPNTEVSSFELNGGARYTIDTVKTLTAREQPEKLWLLLGSDAWEGYHQWHCAEELSGLVEVYVVSRGICPVSSTELRKSLDGNRIPASVLDYIRKEGLYSLRENNCQLSTVNSQLRKRLSPKRARHTLGTESVAATLAMRWGADPKEASYAALLHDMTKEEEQLQSFNTYGIMKSEWEETVPGAYHALTGAALAREMGFSENVISAVRWHTTGRAGMTLLEKIIYLADKTEPFRPHYSGLREIRAEMYRNLDRAAEMALRRIICFNNERGRTLDKASAEALEWIIRKNGCK
jgi:nicotinate-nucleotide adenylyltransferase